ncbi:MAG: hypothetical protein WA919_20470, partial [Coleofasciculaceae cyanobacterium]
MMSVVSISDGTKRGQKPWSPVRRLRTLIIKDFTDFGVLLVQSKMVDLDLLNGVPSESALEFPAQLGFRGRGFNLMNPGNGIET